MAHTYTSLLSHVIFSTKGRVPVLDVGLKERLFPYMGGIVRELGGVALSINGPADHVHLLLSLPPTIALSELIGKVKANSSGWAHKTFSSHNGFTWQVGYAAFSVSMSQRAKVLDYIVTQEEHHRTISFKEELLEFLKKHQIAYDERYAFD